MTVRGRRELPLFKLDDAGLRLSSYLSCYVQGSLREAAEARLGAAVQQVSDAQRAFCRMILRQDNPERSLEDKWADLRSHMHGEGAQQFR